MAAPPAVVTPPPGVRTPSTAAHDDVAIPTVSAVDWVEIRITAEGQLPGQGGGPSAAININGQLAYEEQVLQPGDGRTTPIQGLRAYQTATAQFQVADKRFQIQLRQEMTHLAFSMEKGQFTIFSPEGSLTRDEVDLLDVIGNSILLDQLLPTQPVRLGFTWEIPDEAVAGLLGLESVTENTLQGRVTQLNQGTVEAEASGKVQGRVMGATSQMQVAMRFQWSLLDRRVTALALALRDNRSAGYVDSPFQGTVRLQLTRQRRLEPQLLSPSKIPTLTFPPPEEQTRLVYRSAGGGFQIVHDRRWYVITDAPDMVVFRLVDQRGLLGQCNIARSDSQGPVQLTLAAFQNNVRQALGSNFGQFLEADEMESPTGHRLLRIHALGRTDDVNIHWIYYLLGSPRDGYYAAVFTVDDTSWPLFDGADRKFIDGFHFLEPTPATASGTSSAVSR
ncbi:hypothetical protein [Thermogutta sp.]|uniref:hypothetical protein n=1 Tax=Thermogutta sp. TaxID=1962930 RepID=UPI0032201CC5